MVEVQCTITPPPFGLRTGAFSLTLFTPLFEIESGIFRLTFGHKQKLKKICCYICAYSDDNVRLVQRTKHLFISFMNLPLVSESKPFDRPADRTYV
jgi:hypothetical protein